MVTKVLEENKKLKKDISNILVDVYIDKLDTIYNQFESNIEGNDEYYTSYLNGAISEVEWEVKNNLPLFANNLKLKERYKQEIETYEDFANQQDSEDEDVIEAKTSIKIVKELLEES